MNKRRQIAAPESGVQTRLNKHFVAVKGTFFAAEKLHQEKQNQYQYNSQRGLNGINSANQNYYQKGATGYRSTNRLNRIMSNATNSDFHLDNCRLIEAKKQSNSGKSEFGFSQSSISTACTFDVPDPIKTTQQMSQQSQNTITEASTCDNSVLPEKLSERIDSKPMPKKRSSIKAKVGIKRKAQLPIDQMEMFTKFASSFTVQELKLKDISTNKSKAFNMLSEKELAARGKTNPSVYGYDMQRLEVEYDYETDTEQIYQATDMLSRDLYHAVEFFMKDDPLLLVDNIDEL